MREETRNWLKQAEMDLGAAQGNLQIKNYFVSAFYSQQCAEKALKAFGIERTRETIKTHNLLEIAKKLRLPKEILEGLIELNPDFIVSRYPDAANGVPGEMYDLKKAKIKVLYAEKVLEWAKSRIKK
ncbi:MAG: HEPN domain-containing protein [Candidatus Diapherotrites archaeon]